MKVLVAFASRYGSTRGIAEFIAKKLRREGLDVDLADVGEVTCPERYDALVLGSALYMGRWMKEARRFASRNGPVLSSRPVWLFSSGPTGRERMDAKGRDLLSPSVSGPLDLEELRSEVKAQDHRVFFGAFEPGNLGFFSRQIFKSEAARNAVPRGDFRDWDEIEAWAAEIARSLKERTLSTVVR